MPMKKLKYIFFLSLILLLSFSFGITAYAEEEQNLSVEIISPSSYLEYWDIQSPVDVYVDEDFLIVGEHDRILMHDKNSGDITYLLLDSAGQITVVKGQTEDVANATPSEPMTVTKVARCGNYLIFLNNSRLYKININEPTSYDMIKSFNGSMEETVIASQYFSLKDDSLVVNTSSEIIRYTLTDAENLVFTKSVSYSATNSNVVILSEEKSVYFYNGSGIYKFIDGGTEEVYKSDAVGSINYMEENHGFLYFTSPNGLYKLDLATKECKNLITANLINTTIDTLCSPKGFSVFEDKIYVADFNLKCVSRFSLGEEVTYDGFSISASEECKNRVSAKAIDVQSVGDTLYVFEPDGVREISPQKEYFKYPFEQIADFYPTIFFYNDDYVLCSDGNVLTLYNKVDQEYKALSFTNDVLVGSITDITCYDGDFYIVKNQTIDSVQNACIYKLSINDLKVDNEPMFKSPGTGSLITADVFGELYLKITDGVTHKIIAFDVNNPIVQPKELFDVQENVIKIQTDFDGNLYLLTMDGKVSVNGQNAVSIDKSDYLPYTATIKSMALSFSSTSAYLLYDGFVLKTTDKTQLSIATPSNLEVPKDLSYGLNENVEKVSVTKGVKLFNVEKPETTDDYFKYLSYSKSLDEKEYLVVGEVGAKYYLILREGYHVVRKQDCTLQQSGYADSDVTGGYLTNDVRLYNYPVLTESYASNLQQKHSYVTIEKSFCFNDENYYIVKTENGAKGYLPTSFILDKLANDLETEDFYTAYTINKPVDVFDQEGNVIKTLDKRSKIVIYGEVEDKYYIGYGEERGYVLKSNVKDKGHYAVRNVIVIILLCASLTVTAIYLEIKIKEKRITES